MLVAVFLVVALVLVAFGGLMAAVDAAISALSRAELVELADESRSGTSLRSIAADVGAHLNAVNFVRIIAETTAAVLVTLAFETIFEQWWISLILAAVIMAGVSFVLVGASPRSVGRVHARPVLRFTAPLVRSLRVILGPAAQGLVALGNRVTPGRARSAAIASEEQLLSIVDEATELEVLQEDDRELIHSIFEFTETAVREVMIPRTEMVTVDAHATVAEAMALFLSKGVSRVPVTAGDADEIIGVLYLRDLSRFVFERDDSKQTVEQASLARPALFVPESKRAAVLLREMQLESNHLAMVVDEYGGIAGLVTLEDIIEELVGDISDEYDRDVELIEELGDGRFRVSARVPIDELGDLFGIELDDDEVDTVGGLLAKWLGRLPAPGSSVAGAGLLLTAERVEGRRGRVSTVVVEREAEHVVSRETEEAARDAAEHESQEQA